MKNSINKFEINSQEVDIKRAEYVDIIKDPYSIEAPTTESVNRRFGYTLKPVETISGETESRVIIDT